MIFPLCKSVGVNDSFLKNGYPSTDVIYFATQYVLVFDAPRRCEVYEVESSMREDAFLKNLTAVKKIAAVDRTLVYEVAVDLHNRAGLVEIACRLCKGGVNTVVFKGDDQHMTFVQDPSLKELTVIDVYDTAPPLPSKLARNLRKLEEAGIFGEMMLTFDYHIIDLRAYEDNSKTTIFPCHVSGLHGVFLNCLEAEPHGDIRLVGCSKTKKVFKERFPLKKFEYINTCPQSTASPPRPFIMRCCQPDKAGPIEIGGIPGMVVQWNANPPDIYEAVKQLAYSIRLKKIQVSSK